MPMMVSNHQRMQLLHPLPSDDWRRLTNCSSMRRRVLLLLPGICQAIIATTISVLGRVLDDHQPRIASKHRQSRARNRRSQRRPRHFHSPMHPWPRHSSRGKIVVMPKLQHQKAMGVVITGQGPKPHWHRSGRIGPYLPDGVRL